MDLSLRALSNAADAPTELCRAAVNARAAEEREKTRTDHPAVEYWRFSDDGTTSRLNGGYAL